jgi:aryl-alcohol dehydrogenase-like predicted oxidoreductase
LVSYGPYTNEQLVGRAVKGRRDGVVVATKFVLVSLYLLESDECGYSSFRQVRGSAGG